jgi:hypothetical protein
MSRTSLSDLLPNLPVLKAATNHVLPLDEEINQEVLLHTVLYQLICEVVALYANISHFLTKLGFAADTRIPAPEHNLVQNLLSQWQQRFAKQCCAPRKIEKLLCERIYRKWVKFYHPDTAQYHFPGKVFLVFKSAHASNDLGNLTAFEQVALHAQADAKIENRDPENEFTNLAKEWRKISVNLQKLYATQENEMRRKFIRSLLEGLPLINTVDDLLNESTASIEAGIES